MGFINKLKDQLDSRIEDLIQKLKSLERINSKILNVRNHGRSGLGLLLVKNYCELNDARIEVESRKGKGTKSKIIFPRIEEDKWDST
ncbi:MAG: ATP-binding protein [Bacteroidetes bacterium]|nr:ATP-binding protein [Bacteroidota bacterium]